MKRLGFWVALIILMSFSCQSGDVAEYKKACSDPEIYHTALQKLTDVIVHDIFSPPVASRIYAYSCIAAYEAMVGGQQEYISLAGQLAGLDSLSLPDDSEIIHEIAAVEALLVTGQRLIFSEEKIIEHLGELEKRWNSSGAPRGLIQRSRAYGKLVAENILKWANEDNYHKTRTYSKHNIDDDPSHWRPTPPIYMDAIEPHWNRIRPFTLDSAAQFKPMPPPVFSMHEDSLFRKEVNEVYEVGRGQHTHQREIASFWDCNPYVAHQTGHVMFATKKITPGGHWIGIAQIATRLAGEDMMGTARTLAYVSIGLADAFISCWDEKYRSNLIRPETVIQKYMDDQWKPVLQTPPFPEYTSGHSVISTAAAYLLTDIYGDNFSFLDTVEVKYGLAERAFRSFFEASREAAISRLYGGIHYRQAIEQGVLQGEKVGRHVKSRLAMTRPGLGGRGFPSPYELYGTLFTDVQMSGIFLDSKSFADAVPNAAPDTIMARYAIERGKPDFDLASFLHRWFDVPIPESTEFQTDRRQTVSDHIRRLWPYLVRQPDTPVAGGSLIPLSGPYLVPGGRFREIYYWDSYFTMLGLRESGRSDLIRSMVENFASEIRLHGYIPNGNRTYFLGRSQPPFFAQMVNLLAEEEGPEVLVEFLVELEAEYAFWMDGADRLALGGDTYRRVVRFDEQVLVNRYWSDRVLPREESWREDVLLREKSGRYDAGLFRDLRAACESGWDFSSRWLQGEELGTIRTTDIIPIDLNCLLYGLEEVLINAYSIQGDSLSAQGMKERSTLRARFIREVAWQAEEAYFADILISGRQPTGVVSAATSFPLYFGVATQDQADQLAVTIRKRLLRDGGIVSTENLTGEQWDAPNGWAPLQWITIEGLKRYEHNELADVIRNRWVTLNERVFEVTGKMLEKYDVEDLTREAGGGEYPVQDGFGWTNGVYLGLTKEHY